jgi:hypothetical protein
MSVSASLVNGFVHVAGECVGKLDLDPTRYAFLPTVINPNGGYVQIGNEHFYHYRCHNRDMVFFVV